MISDDGIDQILAAGYREKRTQEQYLKFKEDIASGRATMVPGTSDAELLEFARDMVIMREGMERSIDEAVLEAIRTEISDKS